MIWYIVVLRLDPITAFYQFGTGASCQGRLCKSFQQQLHIFMEMCLEEYTWVKSMTKELAAKYKSLPRTSTTSCLECQSVRANSSNQQKHRWGTNIQVLIRTLIVIYWAVNIKTVKDKFPIPVIKKLMEELHGAQFFTKISSLFICHIQHGAWGYQKTLKRVVKDFSLEGPEAPETCNLKFSAF